jgi:hypothetical protein
MIARATVAVCLLAALACGPVGAAERIRLVERATGEKSVPLSQAPDAAGDPLVFSNPLYDADDRVARGASRGHCVRIEVGRWYDCSITLALEGGTLQAAGSYPDEGDAEFAVVGGTGRFTGARGTLKVHPRDAQHSAYDFVIDLL